MYNEFILGKEQIQNIGAAIGTASHKGAEVFWTSKETENYGGECLYDDNNQNDIYDNKVKDFVVSSAIEEYKTINDKVEVFKDDMKEDEIIGKIKRNCLAFLEGIAPNVPKPELCEHNFVMQLDHPVVDKISATVDYVYKGMLADIKTSKRKIVPSSYTLQQSLYKYVVNKNKGPNAQITESLIFGIVDNKSGCYADISPCPVSEDRVRFIVNSLLKALTALHKGLDPELLFRGNPSFYLCSSKFCSSHKKCSYVHGEM